MLRVAGVRQADLKGYSFSREDVNARALANAYGQTLGQVFTHEMKPYEVEILLAEVHETAAEDELYHILYDGTVMDEAGLHRARRPSRADRRTAHVTLRSGDDVGRRDPPRRRGVERQAGATRPATQLEVALLDRDRPRRAFRRLGTPELDEILGATSS